MIKPKQNTLGELSGYIAAVLGWGIAGILAIVPFYAPLTVLLASRYSHFDLLRIWKELALTGLAVIMIGFLITHRKRASRLLKDKLLLSMIFYAVIVILTALYDLISRRVDRNAVIYGLLVDLRLVGFFGVVFLVFRVSNLYRVFPWRKLILIPAVIVVCFGVLQATVLPADVLSHIGYSKQTIVPYQTVDSRPDIVRVQSTLRGANPLGAYLMVIISLAVSLLLASKKKYRIYWVVFILASLLTLFKTYSRSAWLGTLISLAALVLIYERRLITKKSAFVMVGLLIMLIAIFPVVRNNYQVQNILFHSSNHSAAAKSSNAERASALKNGMKDFIHTPFGGGVGSAGPASLRNTKGQPSISENYFIQIGQEVGILGFACFILIHGLLVIRLWQRRDDPLSRALFASLAGLIIINMVSHAWSDDTLAYTWWGLAGIALSQKNSTKSENVRYTKRKHEVNQKT